MIDRDNLANFGHFSSLAFKLQRRVWLWATLVALAMSAGQAVFSYFHVQRELESELLEIADSNVPLLAVSIWDIEPEVIRWQLKRIVDREQIGYAYLAVKTGQTFADGNASLATQVRPRRFDIPRPGVPTEIIGRLEIYEQPGAFVRELVYAVGVAMLAYGVLTLLICGLVYFFLKRELGEPLRAVAAFVRRLSPECLTVPLRLDRPARSTHDEIDLVVEGFAVLQGSLTDHIANLDRLVAERTRSLEEALETNRQLSQIDSLTGCFNRRLFNERIVGEVERASRYQRDLALVFCDIDHFKLVNDTYGHLVGDEVLQKVAACIAGSLRADIDWVARYGGEEFVIVLPETAMNEAVATAERLRRAIGATVVDAGGLNLAVTASFGVAAWQPGDSVLTLLGRADEMLYAAKQDGRNRTRAAC